jgi:hypothetical protein
MEWLEQKDWHDGLPEGMREDATLRNFDTPLDAIKSIPEFKAYQGNSLRLAGPDASAEARQEMLDKIRKHVPELMPAPDWTDDESVAEFKKWYGVTDNPEDYTTEAELPSEFLDKFREDAIASGMDPRTFDSLMKQYEQRLKAEQEELERVQNEADQNLRNEWGAAYEQRVQATDQLHARMELTSEITPSVRRDLYTVYKQMTGKSSQAFSQPNDPEPIMDRREARERAAELRAKMNLPEHKRLSPDDRKRDIDKLVEYTRLSTA